MSVDLVEMECSNDDAGSNSSGLYMQQIKIASEKAKSNFMEDGMDDKVKSSLPNYRKNMQNGVSFENGGWK